MSQVAATAVRAAIDKRRGWVFAFVAIALYSTNATIGRGVIVAGMHPITLLVGRFGLAALLFGATLALTPLGRPREDQRPLDRFGVCAGLASGALNGAMMAMIFWGLTRISASVSSMITISLSPVFVLCILALVGERFTGRNALRLALALAGVVPLVGVGGTVDSLGVVLLVGGAVLYALHIVSVQWFLRPYNTWAVTTLIVWAAGAVLVVVWLSSGAPSNVPGWGGWLAIVAQGVLTTWLGRFLTYSAIRSIGSGQFALLTPLELMLSVLWAMLFLGEALSAGQWTGGALILASTALVGRGSPHRQHGHRSNREQDHAGAG